MITAHDLCKDIVFYTYCNLMAKPRRNGKSWACKIANIAIEMILKGEYRYHG